MIASNVQFTRMYTSNTQYTSVAASNLYLHEMNLYETFLLPNIRIKIYQALNIRL